MITHLILETDAKILVEVHHIMLPAQKRRMTFLRLKSNVISMVA